MLYRPSDLPPERQARFEEFAEDVRQRTLDEIEQMLRGVEPALAQRTYELAFEPSDALPKRTRRPQLRPAILAVATGEAVDLDEERTQALLGFTVAIQEYFDVLDDIVDGDVAEGHEREAVLVTQVLLPAALRRLAVLGTEAVTYWTDAALEVVSAPHAETTEETPTPETYRRILEHQRVLFGFVTGLAAVGAGGNEAAIERAETVGRTVFEHAQYVLDYEQYASGTEEDPWNAAAIMGEAAVDERLVALRSKLESAVSEYPAPARQRLEALVALDVDEWKRAAGGE